MIKLSAGASKKVPVPNVEFSSRSFSAGMEVEVPSGIRPDEIREKLRGLYRLLEEAIQEQVEGQDPERQTQGPEERRMAVVQDAVRKGAGRGSGRSRRASSAQLRAIRAIAAEKGLPAEELRRLSRNSFGARSADELTLAQASRLIDLLKGNGKESGQ
jgi:hypothetical protein